MRRMLLLLLMLALTAAPLSANPEVTVDLPNGATMVFVWIDPGTFTMGSSQLGAEGVPHDVTITQGFWLGRYEITREQWEQLPIRQVVKRGVA